MRFPTAARHPAPRVNQRRERGRHRAPGDAHGHMDPELLAANRAQPGRGLHPELGVRSTHCTHTDSAPRCQQCQHRDLIEGDRAPDGDSAVSQHSRHPVLGHPQLQQSELAQLCLRSTRSSRPPGSFCSAGPLCLGQCSLPLPAPRGELHRSDAQTSQDSRDWMHQPGAPGHLSTPTQPQVQQVSVLLLPLIPQKAAPSKCSGVTLVVQDLAP